MLAPAPLIPLPGQMGDGRCSRRVGMLPSVTGGDPRKRSSRLVTG
ncbi:MAG TPA: hypothetical protein VGD58_33055 [Herpetosiphonaceae bacterium]